MKLVLAATAATALVALGTSVAGAVGSSTLVGSGCTADATKTLVRKFVRDYSNGRVKTINRLWAPEPRFQWFSTGRPGARLGSSAYNRATLAAHFPRKDPSDRARRRLRPEEAYRRLRRQARA